MGKSKSRRHIIACFMLLSAGLLSMIGISTEAIGCISDPAKKYAGMYFIYPNALGHMWILIETDTGVDDDHKHRVLHLSGSGCSDPHLEYHHYDYDYWNDGLGIPGKKDRRLWVIHATNLSPDCFYDAHFEYRDYYSEVDFLSGCWHSTWGHFNSAPHTSSTNPDYIPKELDFYAFGDTRTIPDGKDKNNDSLKYVTEAIMDHPGKKTFILHTGDIVYKGGLPVGYYYFRDGFKSNGQPEPWLLHKPDWWYYTFFSVDPVREMQRHMPMFTAFGNHEFQDTAVNDKYEPESGKIRYTTDEKRTYNYTHYFRGFNRGDAPKDQYYMFAYGPAMIWSLTSFPMENGDYCSNTNKNYRPKAEGGTGQYDWLKDQLEASVNDPRQWKIVMMHAPMYSPCACNNQEDARKYLKPLFEEYGVDLVLTGHEHYYARKTVNDIPYLILGGGGAGMGLCNSCCTRPPPNYWCKAIENCHGFDMVMNLHHFAYFKITGDKMTVEVINDSLEQIESFTVNRAPDADFEADPAKGPFPLTVKFTDKSTGNVYKYDWDFGDESEHSQERNPTHEYTEEGTYTVKLTVNSAFNNSSTHSGTIGVGPVADFDANPTKGKLPLSVNFYDKSKGDVVSTYLWDFGDGFTATEQDPVHEYKKNGKLSVKLTVTGEGANDTKTRDDYIWVEPYADFFSYPDNSCYTRNCHNDCTFNFWGDHSQGDSLKYHWDFGDGETSTEQNPSHGFDGGGGYERYTVRLTVTDQKGLTDSETRYVHVTCDPWTMHR